MQSASSHDWAEKSVINNWFDLEGKRVFKHLQTDVNIFNYVLNPYEKSEKFCTKPDNENYWGEANETGETMGESSMSRTASFTKWFLAFWPKAHEFDILLDNDYRLAIDCLVNAETIDEEFLFKFKKILNKLNAEHTRTSNRNIFSVEYTTKVLKILSKANDLNLVLDYFEYSVPKIVDDNFQFLAQLISQFKFELIQEALDSFIPPSSNYLTIHCNITKVQY